MKEITVRQATLDDMDTLLQFEQGVIAAERPFDSTLKDGHINYYNLNKLLTSTDTGVMVAVSGSEIVGSGYARIETSKPYVKHDKHAYLGFMYVRPGHRGKGVNQMIIEALKKWAVERGITEFHLQVYPDNIAAIKAYQKAGFVGYMLEMRASSQALSKGEEL